LLALLIAARGGVVSVAQLVDEVWGSDSPPKVLSSVQSYVANLRRALEPDRPARAPAQILLTRPPGYALAVDADDIDAARFQRLAAEARRWLDSDPRRARDHLAVADALWRGGAYADVAAAAPSLAAEAARLEELRLAAADDRYRAELALGGHATLIGELEQQVAAHPLREQTWGLLATALYRSQRQGDALAALRRARRTLADELGIDPSVELRRLESAILAQEPSLTLQPAAVTIGSTPAVVATPADDTPADDTPADDTPADDTPADVQLRLVGRDDWLSRLTGCLVDAAAGRGRLVLITGEPGIGKTGLARALSITAEAMGVATGWGSCEEPGGAPPLWPWTQALGAPVVVRDGDASVDGVAFRSADAVEAMVRVRGPSLLVIDDLHWADEDSLFLLRRLAPRLAALPVALVVSSRDAETDWAPLVGDVLADLARADPVRVRLTGLDEAEVAAFIRLRQRAEVPSEVAGEVWRRSGGNPFFVGEIVQLLAEQQRLGDPAAAAELEVPDGVRDVVRRRVAQLPDDVEPLLAIAAAAGRAFDLDLVEAAGDLGAERCMIALEAALLSGLITSDDLHDYRFTHALVREAIYDRLPLHRRQSLHARLADAIGRYAGGDDAEVARHCTLAGVAFAGRAWRAALRAGTQAAAASAPADAARLHEIAVAAINRDREATPSDRYRVLVSAAVSRKRAGHEPEAWQAACEAAELALSMGDVAAAAEAAVVTTADSIWSSRSYQAVDTAGIALYERLIRELPEGNAVLRARLLAALAVELYYAPDGAARAIALAREAAELVRLAGGAADLARVLELLHVAFERPHLLAERLAAAGELVKLADASGDPAASARALVFRGRDRIEGGQLQGGLRDYARARRLAQAHQVVPVLVALAWADAIMLIATGRFSDAEQGIVLAAELHRSTTLPGATEVPVVATASLHLARGTLASVAPMLGAVARTSGLPLLTEWHALALLHAGEIDEARAVLGPWPLQPEVPMDYMWLIHMAIRAELWAALAPPELARQLGEQLAPYVDRIAFGGTGIAFAGCIAHYAGLLARAGGDLDSAVDHLQRAAQLAAANGFAPFEVRSRTELASLARSRPRVDRTITPSGAPEATGATEGA
jgi:DNA-binding SARP family transcriptional activator